MRVIAGKFKGLSLISSKDKNFRATQEKVREAIFSIIHHEIESSLFLDLFAGSGAIGIEALSRGAASLTGVDTHTDIIKKNFLKLKSFDVKIFECTAKNFLKKNKKKFSIIFMDPPWQETDLYADTLKAIFDFDILTSNGILICEHFKKFKINDTLLRGTIKHYDYGDTCVTVCRL